MTQKYIIIQFVQLILFDLWCYTEKQSAEKIIPPEFGGHTWGFVDAAIDGKSGTFEGTYQVKVNPAANSMGDMSGAMSIILLGEQSISDEISVTTEGFTKGQKLVAKTTMGIVGNIQMIRVKVTNPDSKPWLCNNIEVDLTYKMWSFPCTEKMFKLPKGGMYTLAAAGNTPQSLDLKVAGGASEIVQIQAFGDNGSTIKTVVSDTGIPVGDYTKEVKMDQVGEIYKVTMCKEPGSDIVINKFQFGYASGGKPMKSGKQVKVGTCYSWEVAKPSPPSGGGAAAGAAQAAVVPPKPEPGMVETMIEATNKKVNKAWANTYFDGSCLTNDDQDQIKPISCETKFKDLTDFYAYSKDLEKTKFPSLEAQQIRCPDGCALENVPIIGATIHPLDTLVCLAAQADRAIDHAGGVIQVFMTKAQDSYTVQYFESIHGVRTEAGGDESNVAFSVGKVDTPAMTSKRVRIVGGDGLDSAGRLEVKINRSWNSIKKVQLPDSSKDSPENVMSLVAINACKQLGYKYGVAKSYGSDLTALVPQSELICSGASTSFPCLLNLQGDGRIDHSQDVKIECQEADPTNPNKANGSFELVSPQSGADDTYPVIYDKNAALYLDRAALDTANSKSALAIATQFCKKKGYPKVEKNHMTVDEGWKGPKNVKCITSTPTQDSASNKMKPGSLKEGCKPIKLNCGGSPTGVSLKAKPKAIGRSLGPPVVDISCNDTMDTLMNVTKGDPGSLFTFKCPAGCISGGLIIGTGLQANSSSICKAGLQMAIITNNEDGFVSVAKGQPMIKLTKGVDPQGITSEQYPASANTPIEDIEPVATFAVLPPTTCALFGRASFRQRQFMQESEHVQDRNKEMNKKEIIQSRFKQKLISFMQTKGGNSEQYKLQFKGTAPIQQQAPLETECPKLNNKGGANDQIDLSGEVGAVFTKSLGQGWSIAIGFELDELQDDAKYITIFSHSSNGCYQFIINDVINEEKSPTFQFRKAGGDPKRGVQYSDFVVKPDKQHIVITFFKGKTKMQVNGKKVKRVGEDLDFENFDSSSCTGNLMLQNDIDGHPMVGTFWQFVLFKQVLDLETIENLHSTVKTTLLLPKSGNPLGVLTKDGRPCIQPPMEGPPFPGQAGAPPAPSTEDKSKKMPKKQSSKNGDKTKADIKEEEKMEEEILEAEPVKFESKVYNCESNAKSIFGEDALTATSPGDFTLTGKRITCPELCSEEGKMFVSGPEVKIDEKSANIYSMESSICGAAIHAGFITDKEGGSVAIHISKGRADFQGIKQNNIESKSSQYPDVAIFLKPSPNPTILKCNTSMEEIDGITVGKTQFVECPIGCLTNATSNNSMQVQGNFSDGYTADSSVCKAAIHAGILSDTKKAFFSLKVVGGSNKLFSCKTSSSSCWFNGIQSMSKTAKTAFKFVDAPLTCHQQKHTETSNQNYEQYSITEKKNDRVMQEGSNFKFSMDEPKQAFIKQEFDCSNQQVNIVFGVTKDENGTILAEKDDEQFGIILRYNKHAGQEVYYLLKVMKNKLKIVVVTNGIEDEITEKEQNFANVETIAIYRLNIFVMVDSITVKVQRDPELNWTLLFSVTNDEAKSGGVGLAKNGKVNVNILYMDTQSTVGNKLEEVLLVPPIIATIDFASKALQCQRRLMRILNEKDTDLFCEHPVGYCSRHCVVFRNQVLQKQMCIVQCLDKQKLQMRMLEKKNANTLDQPCKELQTGVPLAKLMKVDYKPVNSCDGVINKNEEQQSGFISALKEENGNCLMTIKYICTLEDKITKKLMIVEKETNKARLEKCGVKLEHRNAINSELGKDCERRIVDTEELEKDQKALRLI